MVVQGSQNIIFNSVNPTLKYPLFTVNESPQEKLRI